jgi:hypothetical protein
MMHTRVTLLAFVGGSRMMGALAFVPHSRGMPVSVVCWCELSAFPSCVQERYCVPASGQLYHMCMTAVLMAMLWPQPVAVAVGRG